MKATMFLVSLILTATTCFAELDYKQLAATKRDQPTTVTTTEAISISIQYGTLEIPKGATVKVTAFQPDGTLVVDFNGLNYSIPAMKTDLEKRVVEIRSRQTNTAPYVNSQINSREATETCRKAAEDGNASAQFELGKRYHNGTGVEKDASEAVKWYRKAAEQGNALAQSSLGISYIKGEGVEKDATEAVKWLRKAARQGNTYAQFNLGVCYARGEGVEKDAAEAVEWFRKAAEQGYAHAQFTFGVCYERGDGVEKDATEAVKWLRKAAEQGYALAQGSLGVCYANGEGVAKNTAEAVKWFRKAEEQGYAHAQLNLGKSYASGDGVAKNPTEAVKWFRKAAEQGYAHAQSRLGACYANGEGVAKDAAEAAKWIRKAAEQGNAETESVADKFQQKVENEQPVTSPTTSSLSGQVSVIASFKGSDIQNTRPFTVSSPWEIVWTSTPGKFIAIHVYSIPRKWESVASNETGKGRSYQPQSGTFYLEIDADGDWQINIVTVPPVESTKKAPEPEKKSTTTIQSRIKAQAALDYPDNFFMQKSVIELQTKSYNELQRMTSASGVPQSAFDKIKQQAVSDYPDNFFMQKSVIELQTKSYNELK